MLGSDWRERDAIDKVAKRIKEQGERGGKSESFDKAREQARQIAIEHDQKKGR